MTCLSWPLSFSSMRYPLLSLLSPPPQTHGGPCTERCQMRASTAASGSTSSPPGHPFWTRPFPMMSSSAAPTLLCPSLFLCGDLLIPWGWSRCMVRTLMLMVTCAPRNSCHPRGKQEEFLLVHYMLSSPPLVPSPTNPRPHDEDIQPPWDWICQRAAWGLVDAPT